MYVNHINIMCKAFLLKKRRRRRNQNPGIIEKKEKS